MDFQLNVVHYSIIFCPFQDPEIQTETGSTSPTEYTAMTTIGNVNEHQAGDYTCANIEDPGIRSHFYVFVPGNVSQFFAV